MVFLWGARLRQEFNRAGRTIDGTGKYFRRKGTTRREQRGAGIPLPAR
jgi:hypothetical protein